MVGPWLPRWYNTWESSGVGEFYSGCLVQCPIGHAVSHTYLPGRCPVRPWARDQECKVQVIGSVCSQDVTGGCVDICGSETSIEVMASEQACKVKNGFARLLF
jgi:hypothetical protein